MSSNGSENPLGGQSRAQFKFAEFTTVPTPDEHSRADAIGCHGTMVLATVVYSAALGGSVLLGTQTPILNLVPPCLCAAAFLCFYGHMVFPGADHFVRVIESAAIVIAVGLSLACLSYLGPITDFPLRDREMIWFDSHLGFDWLQIMRRLDHVPPVLTILDGAYATFTSQLIGTVLVLIAFARIRELDCFFITFVCASVLAELASILLPTLGPMLTIGSSSSFLHLPTLGRATGAIVLALRSGGLRTIDFNAIDGIISFPSLHAAVAVIVPYTIRSIRPLFWPMLILDGLMLISAVPSGNHYLSDVLGGVAVAVLAIACGRGIKQLFDRAIIRWI